MTTIEVPEDLLRRALDGDDTAQQEARALLPTPKPTTNLLGRWAKHPRLGDVLIADDTVVDGGTVVAYLSEDQEYGSRSAWSPLDELTFPEQTTDPEDVPSGEAWLVEVDGKRVHTIKDRDGDWYVPESFGIWRSSSVVTLISPLVPARPTDDGEWVETKEEYEALPEGSIVAFDGGPPLYVDLSADSVAGTRRRVLRKGWGE